MLLHPGAAVVLRRLGGNELDVARMMASGDLASPQRYHNITFYCIRITGTGVSYRPSIDEFVFRRPEDYLTPEFLARCNGLPVIWKHPEGAILNSEEFGARIVGTIMLAYIRDNEVWAVARLYDDATIAALADDKLSTSPSVLLGSATKMLTEDGKKVVFENAPVLLDHICLCPRGVWDKGGDANGVDQPMIEVDARADSIEESVHTKLVRAAHSATMLRHQAGIMASAQRRIQTASRR